LLALSLGNETEGSINKLDGRVRVGMVGRSIIMQRSATPGKSNLHSGLAQLLVFIYSSMCIHTLMLNYTATILVMSRDDSEPYISVPSYYCF
jgi:hypothetical protein